MARPVPQERARRSRPSWPGPAGRWCPRRRPPTASPTAASWCCPATAASSTTRCCGRTGRDRRPAGSTCSTPSGDVWQALRPLGLEEEYAPADVTRDVARRLRGRRSLADLADGLDEPHLRALVRSTAHRQGTTPERAPGAGRRRPPGEPDVRALAGAGRPGRPAGRGARTAPAGRRRPVVGARRGARGPARAARRRRPPRLPGHRGRRRDRTACGASGPGADLEPADAVVLAVDPWTAADLLPPAAGRALRRVAARGRAGPAADGHAHGARARRRAVAAEDVAEAVHLDREGVPVVETTRRLSGRTVRTVHDHHVTVARPGAGLVTSGLRGLAAPAGHRRAASRGWRWPARRPRRDPPVGRGGDRGAGRVRGRRTPRLRPRLRPRRRARPKTGGAPGAAV